MSTISIDSSSDDDCDDYLNSVARLKALKKETKVIIDHSVEENEIKEIPQKPVEPIMPINPPPLTSMININEFRKTRARTRASRARKRNEALEQDDPDLSIVSVENWTQFSTPVPQPNTLNDSFTFDDDLIIVENDVGEDNYEMDVKVLWRSKNMHRLSIRKNEPFRKVFQHFADLEHITIDDILIMRKEQAIAKTDTPASINLSVIDILEGGIVKKSNNRVGDTPDENTCTIKVQSTGKRSISITIKKDEDFGVIFKKCAEELAVEQSKIKLYFDGEMVDAQDTPDSLDIEDEACFDLRVTS